jgi:hypothetical protein
MAPVGPDGSYERVEHEGHYPVCHGDVMIRGLAAAFCLTHPEWTCAPCPSPGDPDGELTPAETVLLDEPGGSGDASEG